MVRHLYVQRNFRRSFEHLRNEVKAPALEHFFFKSKILGYQGKMQMSAKVNNMLVESEHLDSLFYLFKDADNRLTLDLVNIGNDLRMRGEVERSDAFMKGALEAQLKCRLVNRSTVVQTLVNQSAEKLYLEIGVFVGHNFLQTQARRKIAVDPVRRIKHVDQFPSNTVFYELPSDEFFKTSDDIILKKKADVIFIDGLHTYGQSLRDVIHGLDYLKEDGVIVMHDCFPQCKAAAHPVMSEAQQMEGYEGFWNGDVFKAILWLRSNRPDLFVCVIDADHGLGIVKRAKPDNMLQLSDSDIEKMTYETFAANQTKLINLKSADWFWNWSKTL